MPTYEYLCRGCGHEFEREQRITDHPIKTCPKCKKRKAERLISQTSFLLKGSGWHSDLYSSAKPKKKKDGGDGKDKTEKKGSSSKQESKSDSESKGSKTAA
jgi:putative FmdB family regulatory protein